MKRLTTYQILLLIGFTAFFIAIGVRHFLESKPKLPTQIYFNGSVYNGTGILKDTDTLKTDFPNHSEIKK